MKTQFLTNFSYRSFFEKRMIFNSLETPHRAPDMDISQESFDQLKDKVEQAREERYRKETLKWNEEANKFAYDFKNGGTYLGDGNLLDGWVPALSKLVGAYENALKMPMRNISRKTVLTDAVENLTAQVGELERYLQEAAQAGVQNLDGSKNAVSSWKQKIAAFQREREKLEVGPGQA